jgi:hypothetical protein
MAGRGFFNLSKVAGWGGESNPSMVSMSLFQMRRISKDSIFIIF